MAYQKVSLKVCEGCGTLWIREARRGEVYCRPCTGVLQHFPDPKTRLRVGRKNKDRSAGGFSDPMQALGGAR
jgi:hypothetical protein